MDKRGVIKVSLISFILVLLFILILQAESILPEDIINPNTDIFSNSDVAVSSKSDIGRGGATVPITTINLAEQISNYNIKPGRLKFEFDGRWYSIQLRKVKEDHAEFLIMTLDMNKLDDITAYTIDNSFSLKSGEKKEIDINNDGSNDISIELNEIMSTGKYNSIRSADFSINKIKNSMDK